MHATSLTSNFAHFDLQKWLFLWKSVEGVAATCAFWSSLSSHFQVMVCRALWHILILDQRKGNREHKFLIKVMFFFLQKKVIVSLWGFLDLKSELIRKAETQKIREKQTNMALFLRRKSLNNWKHDKQVIGR